MDSICDFLEEKGMILKRYNWKHWESGGERLDIDYELQQLSRMIEGEEELGFISKSIGTYVLSLLINKFALEPNFVVLMGVPFNTLDEGQRSEYKKAFASKDFPVITIQNKGDELASPDQILNLLSGVPHLEFRLMEADTHRYNYPAEVFKLIENVSKS